MKFGWGKTLLMRDGMTIAELCDQYMDDICAGRYLTRFTRPKKATTIATDVGRIETHIRPLLGNLPVASLDRRTVERFVIDIREGKTKRNIKSGKKRGRAIVSGGGGTARRTVALLSGNCRRASLSLTVKGKALVQTIAPESAAISAEIEARVGPDRVRTLLNDLDALIRDLDNPPGTGD